MLLLQLILLVLVGLIGILFNWLLILAIQRKSYYYQETHKQSYPSTNTSLLHQPSPSISGQLVRPPLLPSLRSSISSFDKYILALLVNDIFVCNFIIPLRLIDLSQGLPCAFLCFIFKLFERLATVTEIIILNLLLTTSLIFFFKKRLSTTKLYLASLLFLLPLLIIYLATTVTYLDVNDSTNESFPSSCLQVFTYLNRSTHRTLNLFCCIITYVIIFCQFLILVRMRFAIRSYKQSSLRNISEAAVLTRNVQQEIHLFEQNNITRRSLYTPPTNNVSTATSIATDITPTTQRSFQVFDYITYLTVIENSHTLVKSTYCLLLIYLLVHIPYWIYELSSALWIFQYKDLYLLSHILKPFCYMFTNEKYRYHISAILKCKPFRLVPNMLRRKSRIVTLNDNTTNINFYNN